MREDSNRRNLVDDDDCGLSISGLGNSVRWKQLDGSQNDGLGETTPYTARDRVRESEAKDGPILGKNLVQAFPFDFDLDEASSTYCSPTEQNKKTNNQMMFKKAKFVMKPLDQFLQDDLNKSKGLIQQIPVSQTNGAQQHSLKNRISIPIIGNGDYNSPKSALSRSGVKPQQGLFAKASFAKECQIISQSREVQQISQQLRGLLLQVEEEKEKPKVMKNIFNDNVKLNSKIVTPQFDSGPRYEGQDLVKYSLVGKPEWFKKIESQKEIAKQSQLQSKGFTHVVGRLSLFSASQNNQNNINNSAGITATQSARNVTNETPSSRVNFDQKTMVSKLLRRSTIRYATDQTGANKDAQVQIVTKDHLLMKFSEIEARLLENAKKEDEIRRIQPKIQILVDEQQDRYLNRFEQQQNEWRIVGMKLMDKLDAGNTSIGRSALTAQTNAKFKNTRESLEDTLFARSEDIMRLKKERIQYTEHTKEPFDYIGQKNIWESMLRNNEIDITTKDSQKRRIDEYFRSPKPYGEVIQTKDTFLGGDFIHSSSSTPRQYFEQPKSRQQRSESTTRELKQWKKKKNGVSFEVNSKEAQQDQLFSTDTPRRQVKKDHFNGVHSEASSNRVLTTSNGARVITSRSTDQLEIIRTPRLNGLLSLSSLNSRGTTAFIEPEKSNSFKMTSNVLNTSDSFKSKDKLTTSSSKKTDNINREYGKQQYMEYFQSPNIDSMVVIGESKISAEKAAIQNDGKQRFETYSLILRNELSPKKNTRLSPSDRISFPKLQSTTAIPMKQIK